MKFIPLTEVYRCFCNENLNTTISLLVTKIVTQREEKSFVQQKQSLVSLAHDITHGRNTKM